MSLIYGLIGGAIKFLLKRDYLSCEWFCNYLPKWPLKSISSKNSAQFKISDPVAKINSEKLAVIGYANREKFSKNYLVWSISWKAKVNTFWKLTSQNSRNLKDSLSSDFFYLFINKWVIAPIAIAMFPFYTPW